MYIIVPGSFGSPIPRELREKIGYRLVVQRRRLGRVLARSLVVGCPRHHRAGSTAWRVTFIFEGVLFFAGAA